MANPMSARLAPPMQPPEVCLLSTIPVTVDLDMHWANGFSWAPEGCGNTNSGVWDLCSDGQRTKTTTDPDPIQNFCPFGIWVADRSSTFSFAARDWLDRAKRKLVAAQSKLIEQEALTNSLGLCTQGIALSGGNTAFTNITPLSGPVGPKAALAYLEEAAGAGTVGQEVVFWVTPWETVPWGETMGILTEPSPAGCEIMGERFVTNMGNLVVPVRGPRATSTTVWAYATMAPQIRLGPTFTIPEEPGNVEDVGAWAATTDRLRNLDVVYAEREVSVAWEKCFHVAIQIDRTKYSG